ncbi:MAG: hypothetical protein ACRENS_05565 [Candidatus Eiseniibacteriota bacterium]
MIHVYGSPDPPVPRLLAALEARGHVPGRPAKDAQARDATLVLGPGVALDELAMGVLLGAWRRSRGARVLVLSLIGAHPDARAERLRNLWRLEEWARGSALPVLTLRLAPLLGPDTPLWRKLRSRPRLPRAASRPLNPVDEADALESLERALAGHVRWEGWFEIAGPEALSLVDLAELARVAGPSPDRGEWEPPPEELNDHRLSECESWARHFGLEPGAITSRVRAWAS